MRRLLVVLITIFIGGSSGVNLSFPPGFRFGAATAAYQVEGAWNVSDKGVSIWDTYTHMPISDIYNNETGDIACDSYHLWEVDVEIAAELSLHFYRFSIAWSRLLPNGFRTHISEDGKNYYNKLIDGLLAKGIEPVVTLYHWDLPQRLQDLGGWTNPLITDWFEEYADVAYSLFGDRVQTWLTINEPLVYCDASYHRSQMVAPGIHDSDVGVYLCSKYALLAHAKAYRIYEKKYKAKYNGQVSLANHMIWYEGLTENEADLGQLVMEYTNGRYVAPIFSKEGGWPPAIEEIIAENSKKEGFTSSRLPPFTDEEKELLRGSYDFLALNHYTSRAVRLAEPDEAVYGFPLQGVPELGLILEGRPTWPVTTSMWLLHNPEGLRNCLVWLKEQYGDIPMMITENGFPTVGGTLEDDDRIYYYKTYMEEMLRAIHEDGVNVIGYTAWTMIDNFEWMDGYRSKFGLYEVNFTDPLRTRTARKSARFYTDVIKYHSLDFETAEN